MMRLPVSSGNRPSGTRATLLGTPYGQYTLMPERAGFWTCKLRSTTSSMRLLDRRDLAVCSSQIVRNISGMSFLMQQWLGRGECANFGLSH